MGESVPFFTQSASLDLLLGLALGCCQGDEGSKDSGSADESGKLLEDIAQSKGKGLFGFVNSKIGVLGCEMGIE